jgi:acyl-lipid omega-6 desaturase (Delta-12 desaturase)
MHADSAVRLGPNAKTFPSETRPLSRAAQRRSIRAFRQSSNSKAVILCAMDFALFALLSGAVIAIPNILLKVLIAPALGLQIARLFVLGHDACHQSLFASRQLNRWVGRLLFLPSLTPYTAWEIGHNLGHHVYTNLRGMDYVWTPLSKVEYDALPGWRRLAQRYYRSAFGHGAYYLVELWWRELFFASSARIPARRREVVADSLLVGIVAVLWCTLLIDAAIATQQSAIVLILTGFAIPFLVWNWIMGAVIYLHHTNPMLAWYANIDQWEAARDTGCNTVHVKFRGKLGRVLNNIMEHPAHHLDVRIPLYRLEAANRKLEVPAQVMQTFSLRSILDCISRCKLYDYEAHHWTNFAGHRTGPTLAGTNSRLALQPRA